MLALKHTSHVLYTVIISVITSCWAQDVPNSSPGLSSSGSTVQKGTEILWKHDPVPLYPEHYGGLICLHMVFDSVLTGRRKTVIQVQVALNEERPVYGKMSALPPKEWGKRAHKVQYLSVLADQGAIGANSLPGLSFTSGSSANLISAVSGGKSWISYENDHETTGTSASVSGGDGMSEVSILRLLHNKAYISAKADDISEWNGFQVCLTPVKADQNSMLVHATIIAWD